MSVEKTKSVPPAKMAPEAEPVSSPTAAPKSVTLTVTAAQGLCLRCGPGSGFGVLKVLPCGATLEAAPQKRTDWLSVKTAEGEKGYVSALYVKEVK